jgi:superfamily II RNA helicase
LNDEKLTELREIATRELKADDAEALHKKSAKQSRKESKRGSPLSSADRIRAANTARLDQEATSRDEERLKNFLIDNEKADGDALLSRVEEYIDEQKLVDEVVLKSLVYHALPLAMKIVDVDLRRKRAFPICQRIFRTYASLLQAEDFEKICHALTGLGFRDFADALRPGAATATSSSLSLSSIRFQLQQVPQHLQRPLGVDKDPRVQFRPDEWQRKLLNVVDSGNSALVVAPTASGKTFISYYVMEQCLRSSEDEVVVYVAPTKALVEQVQAEITARFSKAYKGNNVLTGVFTRDFRINALDCQILVTVPACLGVLLLS